MENMTRCRIRPGYQDYYFHHTRTTPGVPTDGSVVMAALNWHISECGQRFHLCALIPPQTSETALTMYIPGQFLERLPPPPPKPPTGIRAVLTFVRQFFARASRKDRDGPLSAISR